MDHVTVRQLRNHGGDVLERVARGERLVVTRDGEPLAELVPVSRPTPNVEVLLARWRRLPPVDPDELRRDLDRVIDPRL